jgi:hypothetical protein
MLGHLEQRFQGSQAIMQVRALWSGLLALVLALSACSGGGGGGGTVSNPVPTISSLTPTTAPQSGAAFTLTVSGSSFIEGSQVHWGQASLTTTYGSTTSLSVLVRPENLSSMGTVAVTVVNPAPGGGSSNSVNFTIGRAAPGISSLLPASVMVNGQKFTLTVNGSGFEPASIVEWNGSPLSTSYGGETALTADVPSSNLTSSRSIPITVANPSGDGGTSKSMTFSVLDPATYLRTVNLSAYNIVWDSTHAHLYASVTDTPSDTSPFGATGHSIVAVEPMLGSAGSPVTVGNGPDPLAISSDNNFLYTGLDRDGKIIRLNLPSLSIDSSFSQQFPSDPNNGQELALSLSAAPQNPREVAAVLGTYSILPNNLYGIEVFQDGVAGSPTGTYIYPTVQSDIEWGADDATLFVGNAETTRYDLKVIGVGQSGKLTETARYESLFETFGNAHFEKNSGLLYLDGGWVVDPATGNTITVFDLTPLVGYFNSEDNFFSPLCIPDNNLGIVFYLGQTYSQVLSSTGATVLAFDIKTRKLLRTLDVPGVTGHPKNFIRWGDDGLAFTTETNLYPATMESGPLYLLDGNFVTPAAVPSSSTGTTASASPHEQSINPQSAAAGGSGFTLAVAGNDFTPSTTVIWNSVALVTTFQSPTALQASVSAADLALAGNVSISLKDSASGLTSTNALTFTVLPASLGSTSIIPVNLSSMNLAWDPHSGRLYLPVLSSDPMYGNSVVAVDPTTGKVTHSAIVMSDPFALSLTDDGAYVYSGFLVANSLTRLSLPNLDSAYSWTLPSDSKWGPVWAYDIQTQPGKQETAAVSFGLSNLDPPLEGGGLTIYDDGQPRSQQPAPSYLDFGFLQWGAGGNVLYSMDTSSYLTGLDVNPSGFGSTTAYSVSLGPAGSRAHYDAASGYLYSDSGEVYDPVARAFKGTFASSGLLAVDSSLNRVFILGETTATNGSTSIAIQSFDKTTLAPVGSIDLPTLSGTPIGFVRWGGNGLAILTYGDFPIYGNFSLGGLNGILYILSDSTFVSANSLPGNSHLAFTPLHGFSRSVGQILRMHQLQMHPRVNH